MPRKITRTSMRSTVMLIGLIFVLSMLLSSFVAYRASEQSLRTSIIERQIGISELIAYNMESRLRFFKELLHVQVAVPVLYEALQARAAKGDSEILRNAKIYMENLYQETRKHALYALLDNEGNVLFSNNPAALSVNYKDREYFQQAMRGEFVRTAPMLSRASGNPVFMMAEGIGQGGKVSGVFSITVDINSIARETLSTANTSLEKHMNVFVVDKEGTVIIHSKLENILRTSIKDEPLFAKYMEVGEGKEEAVFEAPLHGQEHLVTTVPVRGTEWTLFLMATKTLAYDNINSVLQSIVAANILCLLGAVVFVASIMNKRMRKARDAEALQQALAKGTHDTHIVIRHDLEVVSRADRCNVFFEGDGSKRGWITDHWQTLFVHKQEQEGRQWQSLSEALEKARQEGMIRFETVAHVSEERQIPLEVTVLPVYYENADCFVLLCSDMTEMKRKEVLLSNASAAKSIFLATITHEIRTPMNAILGFAHILSRDNLTPSQRKQLEKIQLSSRTLLNIINDVLDISKIEAGKLELEHCPFQVPPLLDAVRSIAGFVAQEKGLELRVIVDPEVPVWLMGDSKRISQILLNLLNNATKFTSEGYVELRVRLQGLNALTAMDQHTTGALVLQMSVADTGIGMTEEQVGRLFKPFTQADSSITRRFGGTGLGLAITKQLVELMDGEIGVVSEPGKGTEFFLTLRLSTCPHGAEGLDHEAGSSEYGARHELSSSAQAEKVSALQGKVVLLVEDNDLNQEIAKCLLEEYGLTVDVAGDGQDAVQQATLKRFDGILMDMQMPVMDGLEATRRLRAMGRDAEAEGSNNANLLSLAHVPIIAMTANAMLEDRQRCLESGMDDYLSKPIEPPLLQKMLVRWLGKGA